MEPNDLWTKLKEAAEQEIQRFKNKWWNPDLPEAALTTAMLAPPAFQISRCWSRGQDLDNVRRSNVSRPAPMRQLIIVEIEGDMIKVSEGDSTEHRYAFDSEKGFRSTEDDETFTPEELATKVLWTFLRDEG